MGKKTVFWGAGEMCRNFLKANRGFRPEYIIDNDRRKAGSYLSGIEIVSPEILLEDRDAFVVVISQYEKEIFDQLERSGRIYGVDYLGISSLYQQPVPFEIVQEALEETYFPEDRIRKEIFQRVNSMEEYRTLLEEYTHSILYEKSLARIYYRMPGKMGKYQGYCENCGTDQDFEVDYCWSEKKEPAWRETLTCPQCRCNSRMRFVSGYLKEHYSMARVYCYEASTVLFRQLQSFMKDIIGSEYLGDHLAGGTVVNGVMHQDALNLSFDDSMFDVMVSCDVFEHVADYRKALREAWRCLVPGGELVVSVPIFKDRYENVARTVRNEKGELSYLLPPVYHGNPLSGQGSLVFQEFGWHFLDDLREAGFRESYGLVYFSVSKGYLGELPVVFIARK